MTDASFWEEDDDLFGTPADAPDGALVPAAVTLPQGTGSAGASARRTRPWWRDAWVWVLPVSLVATAVACVLLFIGLASVRLISTNPLGDLVPMLGGAVACLLIGLVCLVVAVVMLVTRRRRGIAVGTLVTTVLIAPAGLFLTLSAGLDQVKRNAEESIGGRTAATIADIAHENGIDLGILEPLVELLHK